MHTAYGRELSPHARALRPELSPRMGEAEPHSSLAQGYALHSLAAYHRAA